MPYLYTTAEEMSRTGLPIERPLFLEFPNATKDLHPIDLDAGGEFLFGPDLLVAPPAYPDELDAYEVQLPPGIWYDYWTGERIDRSATVESRDAEQKKGSAPSAFKPVIVKPSLALLPVYARGGSIIPIAPLTQSTSEKPNGSLTLRVYVGEGCKGTIYLDDGISYDFKQGKYLRMESSCFVKDEQLHVRIGAHQGSYPAWWSQISLEVYGWTPKASEAVVANQILKATTEDNGTGMEIMFK
jgi:alpha-glucosidase